MWCFRAPWFERIFSGAECVRDHLGQVVDELGADRVVIVTGRTLAGRADLMARVTGALGAREVVVFAETTQHSPRPTVIALAAVLRKIDAQCVVSFGGGTPIDTAKLAAMCVAAGVQSQDALDALHMRFPRGGKPVSPTVPASTLPHIAIPTTLSAGEYTDIAGSTDLERRTKHVYACPGTAPRTIFLDPQLAAATPEKLWASTGIRAIDHAAEGYCTITPQPINDAMAVAALRMLCANLPRASRDPDDLAAREACLTGSALSLAGAARNVAMGLSHSLARQLGGRYGVPHGIASALTLPAVLAFNASVNGARQRELAAMIPGATGGSLADTIAALVRELGVAARLRDWNVPRADLDVMAEDALSDWGVMTNPRRVAHAHEIVALLEEIY
jgi:maleylacetate reductase